MNLTCVDDLIIISWFWCGDNHMLTYEIFPYYSSWHVGWDILSLEVFFKGVISILHVFLALIGKHLVVHAPMHWFTVLIKS